MRAPFGYCRYCGGSEHIIERGTCRDCSMRLQGALVRDENGRVVLDARGHAEHLPAELLVTRYHDADGGEIVPDRNGHALCLKCGPEELRP